MIPFARPSLVWALWLVMMALLGPLYMTVPPSPDQSQFDWMALIAAKGTPFYAGSFDMNWPGAMWLHEAGIRLFGVHGWTWRLTDFLLMAGFTGAGALFLSRADWRMAPVVFLFLYPPLYITAGAWMAGQRDIIATGFLLVACAFALPTGRREALNVLIAGLCVAAAVLIRPTFLSFIAGLMLLEALPLNRPYQPYLSRFSRAMLFGAGLILGIGAAVLAGLLLGNLDDWYQQSVAFSFSVYIGEPPQDWRVTLQTLFLRSWHWITALGLVGLAVWVWRDRLGYSVVLVLGIAATLALSFAVQNKGFGYHLGGILTVLVLGVAVALDSLNRARQTARQGIMRLGALAALGAVGLVIMGGTASKLANLSDGARGLLAGDLGPTAGFGLTEAERRSIVATIQNNSTPDDTVIVYGNSFELAYRAERLPPHRFINAVIDQADTNFAGYDAWRAEIDAGLAARPPAFIILARRAIDGEANAPKPAHGNRPVLSQVVALVNAGYAPVFANDHVVVYQAVP